jgi:hypothetical protein
MQRRKIIVNNDTYETFKAIRKTFMDASRNGQVSDDLILMAAFSALAEKMYNAQKSKKEVVE